jgi:hypothetical protein
MPTEWKANLPDPAQLRKMTLKEQGMQAVIESQDSLIKELTRELRMIRRKNLKMKLHLSVLVGNPNCKTSETIKDKYKSNAITGDSILHYN